MHSLLSLCILALAAFGPVRETVRLDTGWKFAQGDASSPEKDFGAGTEYFNYLTKAHSIHNTGPYTESFDDSDWEDICLPHDWVTTLPYAPEASHSHGYKTVGYKYPATSVGWYRKVLRFDPADEGDHFEIRFDGIFRNATVWFNGFYLGTEPSGYTVQTYEVSDYIDFKGDNVLCVRADATLEEGWFYEGAGIYRDVWLTRTGRVHVTDDGTFLWGEDNRILNGRTEVENTGTETDCRLTWRFLDMDGHLLGEKTGDPFHLRTREKKEVTFSFPVPDPQLWDLDRPYFYTVETLIEVDGKVLDRHQATTGLRTAVFDPEQGFLLNGRKVVLKGVNLHQDHAGVGSAIPEALLEWRVKRLKELGVNAIRSSHNPASPALLDICDRLGVLFIDENRLMGTAPEQLRLLEKLVRRGRNHPCIILWSVGNEEWGLENDIRGRKVVEQMQAYVHLLDPSRPTTAANAGGATLIHGLQVHGYNYIVQNDVLGRHGWHPEWCIFGSEETTGCGTRGVYYPETGRMPSINRTGEPENVIERGWTFYRDNPWTGGVFFWTGFDYKGEPNPLHYPAVISEFGILDYCGFYKDEAWYLKAQWTDEPVLHILPHWNLQGHEGGDVEIWAYTNCDEVRLTVNGKSLGKQAVPSGGHVKWTAVYKPGKVKAEGYVKGKKVLTEMVHTTEPASTVVLQADRTLLSADGRDAAVVTVSLIDPKGNPVPDAGNELSFTVEGCARILGAGNGDPAWLGAEKPAGDGRSIRLPAFNGLAQILVQAGTEGGSATLRCQGAGLQGDTLVFEIE